MTHLKHAASNRWPQPCVLSPHSSKPLYMQIARSLTNAIGKTAVKLPRQPSTPNHQIHAYLKHLQLAYATDGPFIYPHVVSFPDSARRHDWAIYWGHMKERSTMREFWLHPKHGKKTWLALFSSPPGNWVGVGENHGWVNEPWHCFALLVVNRSDRARKPGKMLVFWDPDPNTTRTSHRIKDTLRGIQWLLFQHVRKHYCRAVEVWYSWDERYAGRGQCLQRSLERITVWAEGGDRHWHGSSDERTLGFERLALI